MRIVEDNQSRILIILPDNSSVSLYRSRTVKNSSISNQPTINEVNRNRFSWFPFARVRMT